MSPIIIVSVLAATSLGFCAWKFPNVRAALIGAAVAFGGLAGLLIALAGAKGDINRAKRSVQAKRQIKTSMKKHKKALIEEQRRVDEVQVKIDSVSESINKDEPLDLSDLAERFNSR